MLAVERMRLVVLLAAAVVFPGCGGGGGGGTGSAGGRSGSPIGSGGGAPSLVLTEKNAVEASALVLGPMEHVHLMVQYVTDVADILHSDPSARVLRANCITAGAPDPTHVDATLTFDDNDASSTLSAGDVIRVQHGACAGYTRDLTLSVTAVNYADASGTLDGHVKFTAVADSGVRTQGSFDLTASFDSAAGKLTETLTNIAVTTADGATVTRLTDASSGRRYDKVKSVYDLNFAGTVDSTLLGGRYTFSTAMPLEGAAAEPPTDGELDLTGSGSAVRITPSGPDLRAAYFDYQVDSNGSGQYGTAQHARWTAVIDGPLFYGWDGNAKPQILSLTLSPPKPNAAQDLVASYTASDPDGDTLTYSQDWWLNGTPVASDTSTLKADLLKKGATIRFTLTASDGRAMAQREVSAVVGDAPPQVTVTLSPSAPKTTANLRAVYSGTDPDGDALTATFQWLRNGKVIPGETGQNLSSTLQAKSDVITAIVSVSDGEATTSGQASVTIQDSLPVVEVQPLTHSVDYGTSASFQATASDADGDPTTPFVLLYGPAGMSIDPNTGVVTWVASGPQFGSDDTSANWAVSIDRPGANVVTGSVGTHYTDPALPLLRTGVYAPLSSGIKIGDFDGDGSNQMLIVSAKALYELKSTGSGYRESWVYPLPLRESPRLAALTTGDTDGDGRDEIFVGDGAFIFKLDGVTRRITGSTGTGAANAVWRDLEFGDLDNDGRPELVGLATTDRSADPAARSTLVVFHPDHMNGLYTYEPRDYGASVAIGNVDDDPQLEIVTGGGYVIDNETRLVKWHYSGGFGRDVQTVDLDGDGIDEIVGTGEDGTVRAFSAKSHSVLWSFPSPVTDALAVADVTGDGVPEIVLGDGGTGQITVYRQDVATGKTSQLYTLDARGTDVAAIALGDVDNDGSPELVWGSNSPGDALVVASANPPKIEWSNTDASATSMSGPYFGGELAHDAAGPPRLLFGTIAAGAGGLRMVAMDPSTGDFELSPDLGRTADGQAAVTLADYDRDGTDEAFLASSADSGAYDLAYDAYASNTEWMSAPFASNGNGVAVAHGDFNGDGAEDLVSIDSAGVIRVYDVADDTPMWTSPALQNGVDVAVAELDGANPPEIVAAADDQVFVYAYEGGTFVRTAASAQTFPGLRDLAVGDVDGDGQPDVFVLFGSSGDVQRLDANLVSRGGFVTWPGAAGLAIEQSSFPRKNLLWIGPGTYPRPIVIDALSGATIQYLPQMPGAIAHNGVHYVDVAGDGKLKLSVATSLGTFVTQ